MSVVVVVIPQRRRVAQGLGSSNAAQQSDIVKEIQEEVSIVQSYVGSGQEKSGDLRRNDHVVWYGVREEDHFESKPRRLI